MNSFSVTRRGTRGKVKEALLAEVASPEGTPQHQIKAAVAYAIAQIDALPEEFNSVAVAMNGQLEHGISKLESCVVKGETLDL